MLRRDWSKIAPNSPAGWLLRLPLKLVPSAMVVRVGSGLNKGMKWRVGSSVHGCWLGTYELEKQTVVKNSLNQGWR